MRPAVIVLAGLLLLLPQAAGEADAPAAEDVLLKVDEALSPAEDFSMRVKVTDSEPGQPPKVTEFRMLAKGRDRTLLLTLSPESKRGRNLLFNALELWVYMPSVRRPFKISLQERLTGEAANADLARAHYSRDYSPALAGVESLDGRRCHRLELTARTEAAPYHRVSMWVEAASLRPLKAEFYAVSGRLLKECSYEDYRPMLGVPRPTRLVLKNAVNQQKTSVLQYSDWAGATLAPKFLEKSYIDKTKY
jgi:outer membrane lipoprotein-sorting protein